jgi:hypothetical protein
MADPNPYLTAPIPGMSLVSEPGSYPWEQPPQFVTIDEVAQMYSEKMNNPEAIDDLMKLLEGNLPISSIVNGMITMGIMKGFHTVDTGFLVTPVIAEIIKTLAELNDVPYHMTAEDIDKEKKVSPSIIRELIKEAKTAVQKNPEAKLERRGLMARGEE